MRIQKIAETLREKFVLLLRFARLVLAATLRRFNVYVGITR